MSETTGARALRLECLKLALTRSGAADARPWRAIAEDFHAWIAGEGGQPADAPEAAPRGTQAQTRGQARAASVPPSGRAARPRRDPA